MITSAKNQDKGFTLVELLIVIVILGILATVTVFAVSGVTTTATTNACQVEEKNLETAVQAYFASNTTNTIPAAVPTGTTETASPMGTLKNTNFLNADFDPAKYNVVADGTVSAGADC